MQLFTQLVSEKSIFSAIYYISPPWHLQVCLITTLCSHLKHWKSFCQATSALIGLTALISLHQGPCTNLSHGLQCSIYGLTRATSLPCHGVGVQLNHGHAQPPGLAWAFCRELSGTCCRELSGTLPYPATSQLSDHRPWGAAGAYCALTVLGKGLLANASPLIKISRPYFNTLH